MIAAVTAASETPAEASPGARLFAAGVPLATALAAAPAAGAAAETVVQRA